MSKIHFYEITGDSYLNDMNTRLLGNLDLIWIKQFRKVILPYLSESTTILDLGCGSGYLYKYFHDLNINYIGIDGEERLLNIGKSHFKDNKKVKFYLHDIQEKFPDYFHEKVDITVCSATLEHLPNIYPTIEYISKLTNKYLYIRTFLGETSQLYSQPSPVAEYSKQFRKHINQYSFDDLFYYLREFGFNVKVLRDEYTDSMPYDVNGVCRCMYILFAENKFIKKV